MKKYWITRIENDLIVNLKTVEDVEPETVISKFVISKQRSEMILKSLTYAYIPILGYDIEHYNKFQVGSTTALFTCLPSFM